MSRVRILLFRAGIIILAFVAIGLLWLSKGILPEGYSGAALRGGISCAVFFVAWAFSMQVGEEGGVLNGAPKKE